MTEKLNLEAIEARCEAASEWLSCDGTYLVYLKSIADVRADISALASEVKRLRAMIGEQRYYTAETTEAIAAERDAMRASLEAVLEEAESDFDRDVIVTECQSALAKPEEAT